MTEDLDLSEDDRCLICGAPLLPDGTCDNVERCEFARRVAAEPGFLPEDAPDEGELLTRQRILDALRQAARDGGMPMLPAGIQEQLVEANREGRIPEPAPDPEPLRIVPRLILALAILAIGLLVGWLLGWH